MKKLFLMMSMAAAMISLAGCQKNEMEGVDNNSNGSSTFELIADINQNVTKTTLDGRVVEWEEGDIIYVVTTDETWGAAYVSSSETNVNTIAEFTYADGKFTTEATIADGSYTFNAMYARADQKTWHRGAASSHSLSSTQSQDCTDPTAHIKENDALVGTFDASVPADGLASVTMNHIYTMMQVDVKNSTGADIEVTKFEMTAAGADLAGVFTVKSFATPSIELKSSASESIAVNITEGTIASGATLPVYFVMAPIADYSGEVTFKVTDSEGNTYTKTVEKTGLTFEAGKYNATSYTISEADEAEDYSGTYAIVALRNSESMYYYLTNVASGTRLAAEAAGNAKPEDGVTLSAAKLWDVSKSGSSYTIKSVDSEEYVSWTSGNAASMSEEPFAFNVVKNEDGRYSMSAVTDNTRYLSLNNNKGNNFFAMYAGTQIDELYLISSVEGEEVLPDLSSIAVSGQKTSFVVGNEFSFGGTVTATYSNGVTKDVTASATFSGYDMSTVGEQTVTVTYEGLTTTYDIVVSEAAETEYNLYTGNLVEGDYIIVYEGGAMKASVTSGRLDYSEVEFVSDAIYNPDASVVWHISKSGDYWTIYNASVNKYAAGTGAKNKAQLLDSGADDKSLWTATGESTYEFVNKANADANVNKNLRRNGNYGFACYATSTGGALSLYKLQD